MHAGGPQVASLPPPIHPRCLNTSSAALVIQTVAATVCPYRVPCRAAYTNLPPHHLSTLQIRQDQSEVYGDGFRIAYDAFQRGGGGMRGLASVVNSVLRTGRLQ
eukprot:232503-Chlamydomonas_euryale.AAC.1